MDMRWKKSGLVLWSLIFSPCIWDPERSKSLFSAWEDMWRKEKIAPWVAKVPISSVALPGEYSEIHGLGGMTGWFETYSGYIPSSPILPIYHVFDDTSVTVESPAQLSYRTKKCLGAWLKRAYPQRFRPPKALAGVNISWAELFGTSSNLQHLTNFRARFVETQIDRAKASFGELSPPELEGIHRLAEQQFSETMKTYRKRRRRALSQALRHRPRFMVIQHPVPEYYLCAGRPTAFMRCVVSWNKDGEEKTITPELPFIVNGAVTLP